jgi:hypothetical protein
MGGVRRKKEVRYTIEELQSMLQTFEDTHERKGNEPLWQYDDAALMQRDGAEEFFNWVKEQS